MEVGHSVGTVVGRRQAVGPSPLCPAGSGGGTNTERPEPVERERPVGEAVQDVLDSVELGVTIRIDGLLPRLRSLEGDASSGKETA